METILDFLSRDTTHVLEVFLLFTLAHLWIGERRRIRATIKANQAGLYCLPHGKRKAQCMECAGEFFAAAAPAPAGDPFHAHADSSFPPAPVLNDSAWRDCYSSSELALKMQADWLQKHASGKVW